MFETIKNYKKALFTIFFIGMIVHFTCYSTGEIGNPDTVLTGMVYTAGKWEISLGRWGLLADHLRQGIVSNVLNSIISILITSFAMIILACFFEIKSKTEVVLIGAVFVTAPAYSAVLTYYYCSDLYAVSIFLFLFSAYIIKKCKGYYSYAAGVVCFVLATSIYQAYIGITVSLLRADLFLKLLQKETDWKKYFAILVKYILFIFVSAFSYYAANKIILKLKHIPISSYGGADKIGIPYLVNNIPKSFIGAYQEFYEYFMGNKFMELYCWYAPLISILLLMILCGTLLLCISRYHFSVWKLFMSGVIVACFPIGVNLIRLIAPDRKISLLMAVPMAVVIPICLCIFIKISDRMKMGWVRIIGMFLSVYFIFVYSYIDNASYMNRKIMYNRNCNIAERILDRIEPLYESTVSKKVMFVGNINDNSYYKREDAIKAYAHEVGKWGITWDNYAGVKIGLERIYDTFFGIKLDICTDEEYIKIIQKDVFAEMGIFPETTSIRVIDDIIVVRLSEHFYLPEL